MKVNKSSLSSLSPSPQPSPVEGEGVYSVQLYQPAKGYRYGIDSFLLARFAHFKKTDVVCDLGAGVGILGLLAIARGGVKEVTAVEVQKELAAFAEKNAQEMRFEDRMKVLVQNWKDLPKILKRGSFDVVISNPPYRKKQTGRISPHPMKAIAKHELVGNMEDLIVTAQYLLKNSGRFYLIYPILRLEELILNLNKFKFKIQRMAFIHSYLDRPATHVMVEAVRSVPRELKLEAPVIVYRDPDHYTPEVEEWVGEKRINF
jgi:tRNA1Val (adenine37-N6)-methyltransferase